MKIIKYLTFIAIPVLGFSQSGSEKVGINTPYPVQLFHIDGIKNNTSFVPPSTETSDDIVITTQGRVGIGTINPTNKMEIDSNEDGVSGLMFTRLTSSSPATPSAGYIGIDNSGNIVRLANPKAAAFTQNSLQTTDANSFIVNGGNLFDSGGNIDTSNYAIVPNSSRTLTDQDKLNIYFVNYTFSADILGVPSATPDVYTNTGGSSYYECRLFIDNLPTTAAQTLKEYEVNGSVQFALNYVKQLSTGGTHVFDVRIMRVQNSGTESNTTQVVLSNFSLISGVSVLNFN